MLKALTTAALLILPGTAMAADWGPFYAQIYGGARLPGLSSFDTTVYPMESGPSFGASIGAATAIDGLSVGLDVMHSSVTYTDFPNDTLSTLTIMGTIEGAFRLNDRFELYGTGGLGAMNIAFSDASDPTNADNGWAPAYQFAAGLRVKATEQLSFFTELKHQDTFVPVVQFGDENVTSPSTSVLVGLRFSTN